MNLEWHELLTNEENPDFPKEGELLLFYIFETDDVYIGRYFYDENKHLFISTIFRGFGYPDFSSPEEMDDDLADTALVADGFRIGWAYIDMNKVSFPKFEAEEKRTEEAANEFIKMMKAAE